MTDKKTKPATATIQLAGDTEKHFEAVKAHMSTILPYVTVDRASVLRHALYMAAESIRPLGAQPSK